MLSFERSQRSASLSRTGAMPRMLTRPCSSNSGLAIWSRSESRLRMVMVPAPAFVSTGWAAALMRNSGGGGCGFRTEKTLDLVEQFGRAERFGEAIVGAKLQCQIEKTIGAKTAAAGNRDDRNLRKL